MIYDISGHDLYKGLIYTFITWKRTLDCLPLYTWQQVKSFTSKPKNWLFESQNTNLEDQGSIIMKLYTRLYSANKS